MILDRTLQSIKMLNSNLLLLAGFILLIFSQSMVIGQTSRPDTLVASKVQDIQVDGLLNEPAWSTAHKIMNFTQRELQEGEPATETTQVAVLFSKHSLYIGFWAFDSEPEKIVAQQMKHDFSWSSDDNMKVILSPFYDHRNGYLFVINPNGAYADVLIRDEGSGYNIDWNGVWYVKVTRTEEGWFAEAEIPFSTLRFPKKTDQIWGFNVERYISRKNEQVLWQGWSRDYSLTKISQAGTLIGLERIAGKRRFEFKPFISGGVEKTEDDPLESKAKVGGDINVSLSPTMRLNLTLNTDFSQVESDRAQINLSRFSISYPEKREFFLEEKSLFEFNVSGNAQAFYTRRIGIHNREEVPIIGGARLIGKSKNTNIGILSIQTVEKDTLPTTNYTVVRLRQDVFDQSNIGMIVTAKNQRGHYNYVYGIDANYVTSKIFGDKNLEVGGALTQSFTEGEDIKNNLGYRAYLSYPNDFIEYSLSVSSVQKKYNPEIGYLRRNNYTVYSSELAFNPRPKWIPWINQMEFKPFELSYYVTQDTRKMETVSLEVVPLAFETTSDDQFEFNVYRIYDRLDEPFEIIDDVFIPVGDYWYNKYAIEVDSYSGRSVSVGVDYDWGDFYTGKRKELQLQLDFNINRNFKISGDWEQNTISLGEETFTTHEVGGRLEYEFSPKLFTTLFGQWNNEDEEMLFNFRLNWIPKSGSYFYFIINQEWSNETGIFTLDNTTILTKFIWVI